MTFKKGRNKKLVESTFRYIKKHQDEWDQDTWGTATVGAVAVKVNSESKETTYECGTVACLAGHIAHRDPAVTPYVRDSSTTYSEDSNELLIQYIEEFHQVRFVSGDTPEELKPYAKTVTYWDPEEKDFRNAEFVDIPYYAAWRIGDLDYYETSAAGYVHPLFMAGNSLATLEAGVKAMKENRDIVEAVFDQREIEQREQELDLGSWQ